MSNYAKIREEAKKLNPIDDLLFRKMAEEREFCQEILRVILGDAGLIVTEHYAQYYVTNLQGRSVILDAVCVLSNGEVVNIEVQKENNDDHQRRVRYNGSLLAANISDPGMKFKCLQNICVVYISKFDVFDRDMALYHVDRVLRETGEVVDNGFQEVYVNASAKDGSDISELMRVFTEDETYNERFPITSKAKNRYKNTEEGVAAMCDILKNLVEEETKMLNDQLVEAKKVAADESARAEAASARALDLASRTVELAARLDSYAKLLRENGIPIPTK